MFKKQLAPNDPKRVPKEHRELINKMFEYFRDNNYSIAEMEFITQAVSVLKHIDSKKFMAAAYAIGEIAKMVDETKDGKFYLEADLQVLGMKMTESLNSMSLSDVQFKRF